MILHKYSVEKPYNTNYRRDILNMIIRNNEISIDTRYFISSGTELILQEMVWDFLYDRIDHE